MSKYSTLYIVLLSLLYVGIGVLVFSTQSRGPDRDRMIALAQIAYVTLLAAWLVMLKIHKWGNHK